ncbi:MAG: hypothetical protein ACRYFR_04085 [Janthinobacterium lividum]
MRTAFSPSTDTAAAKKAVRKKMASVSKANKSGRWPAKTLLKAWFSTTYGELALDSGDGGTRGECPSLSDYPDFYPHTTAVEWANAFGLRKMFAVMAGQEVTFHTVKPTAAPGESNRLPRR